MNCKQCFASSIILLPMILGSLIYKEATEQPYAASPFTQTPVAIVADGQPQSPLPTPTVLPPPMVITLAPTRTPRPTPAPIVWAEPPPCVNQPLGVADWQKRLQTEPGSLNVLFQSAQSLSPALRALGDAQKMQALLAQPQSAASVALQEDALALLLNVASGALNRLTEIQLAELPAVHTVGDLLALLETANPTSGADDPLHKAAQAVLTGQVISNPVCANMLVLQASGLPTNGDLQTITWSGQGLHKTSHNIWERIAKDHRSGSTVQISPDFKKLIIKSYCLCEGVGFGPLYLYDFASDTLVNLNLVLGLNGTDTKDEQKARQDFFAQWQVVGWHPNGHELLIGVGADPTAIWVDLEKQTFGRWTARHSPFSPMTVNWA